MTLNVAPAALMGAVTAVSVGRWRSDLSAAEQQEVERLCGPRLRELEYER